MPADYKIRIIMYRSKYGYSNSIIGRYASRFLITGSVIVWFYLVSSNSLSFSDNALLRGATNANRRIFDGIISKQQILPPKTIDLEKLNHAIIVPGHAVMRRSKQFGALYDEEAWYLLPYQKGVGFPQIIASHIRTAVDLMKKDDESCLIMSGGQTRKDVGPISEAVSYYYLAEDQKWITQQDASRVFLEEYARDSFENLLFSVSRFREVTGRYPSKITVVGFDFKDRRFSDLHRRAIGFPESNFTYIGLRPLHKLFDHVKASEGEKLAYDAFVNDMYGCNSPDLVTKRTIRNPYFRTIPYSMVCPEIKGLLEWCGPNQYHGILPWLSTKKNNEKSFSRLLTEEKSPVSADGPFRTPVARFRAQVARFRADRKPLASIKRTLSAPFQGILH